MSAALHLKCADHATRGASFCSGAQGGAFAIRKGPRATRFAKDFLDEYLNYYANILHTNQYIGLNHSSYAGRSFGADQPPLAKLMEEHCNLKNQSSQITTFLAIANAKAAKADDNAARKRPLRMIVNDQDTNPTTWSFGPLPSSINVRDTERSKGRCVAPIFGPLILLHHKRYVNHGNLSEATKRLDALCRHSNRPHHLGGVVWLDSSPSKLPDKGGAIQHHSLGGQGVCEWMHPASSSSSSSSGGHHHSSSRPHGGHHQQHRSLFSRFSNLFFSSSS